MSPETPWLITLITAALGALWLAPRLARAGRGWPRGLAAGALAGALGPQLFMLPLEYCPFNPEHHLSFTVFLFNQPIVVNMVLVLAVLLIAVGTFGLLLLAEWLLRLRVFGGTLDLNPRYQPGMFRARWWMPWALLAPTLIILIAFSYYPTYETFRLSTLLARLGAPRSVPVCLDNFANLIAETDYYVFSERTTTAGTSFQVFSHQSTYLNSFGVSFFMAFFIVVIAIGFSLLIALAAYQPIRGARIYRTLLIWPYAISPVVAGIIFYFLFNPLSGVINYLLRSAGLEPIPWLLDPNVAPWAVIAASVWNIMGFNILFYIAALQNVPSDLLEAASIDGANGMQRFFRITVPLLSPITFFLVITNVTYAFFDTFGVIDYLTTGGPVNATSNLIYDIFVVGIQERDLGRAAAQSILLLMIVIGLTVFQFRSSGRRVNYGA